LPKRTLGKAVAYTLNQDRSCCEEVELSNNVAENSMRPVALERKNWLHVVQCEAEPKVAAILYVVESCRRIGLPLKDYLAGLLPGVGPPRLSAQNLSLPE
jgi:hypothetical protein